MHRSNESPRQTKKSQSTQTKKGGRHHNIPSCFLMGPNTHLLTPSIDDLGLGVWSQKQEQERCSEVRRRSTHTPTAVRRKAHPYAAASTPARAAIEIDGVRGLGASILMVWGVDRPTGEAKNRGAGSKTSASKQAGGKAHSRCRRPTEHMQQNTTQKRRPGALNLHGRRPLQPPERLNPWRGILSAATADSVGRRAADLRTTQSHEIWT